MKFDPLRKSLLPKVIIYIILFGIFFQAVSFGCCGDVRQKYQNSSVLL